VREIPKLKELHEKYGEEIAFVSVSVDPQKEKWENFLKARELEGYQLYSGKNFESEIISDYMVQGIPRFVMIDPEGKIINVDAPRPSSKETEKIMKKWINSEG
jgi:cytochrome oxidase Cu insertion factor (SCO1/SenC/PrrC family)